ncbi:hypothetical protein CYMTET_22280 [Cymbomonas tetramitiformis]|uniref:Chromo domain-containing protein n=1 Tax=Cymbomonas tetramitiformis TaxID=36881 RepID=A0AAE0G082_9CHLO|nr:hypothetical protein CYMTET_22280 [Cymbomonas tetramitiformis]
MASRFAARLEDARAKLEQARHRQRTRFDLPRHKQQEYQIGDLVWVEARHLTETVMDPETCRKLSPRDGMDRCQWFNASTAFALRKKLLTPTKVIVDGQSQTHVAKILARRLRKTKSGMVEEFRVRWTGYSTAHDSWKTREAPNYGGELKQLREFEKARLSQERQLREKALTDAPEHSEERAEDSR